MSLVIHKISYKKKANTLLVQSPLLSSSPYESHYLIIKISSFFLFPSLLYSRVESINVLSSMLSVGES